MLAKLTLAGLDRWTKSGMYEGSNSLWDLLNVPAGVSKDTLVNAILYKSFEFPVAYMDAESVREQIGLLSDMWQDSMSRTWDALTAEYNPIHNFDRHEEYTDEHTGETSSQEDGTGSTTGETSGTEKGTGKTTGETSDTDTGTSTQTGTGKTTGKTSTKNSGTTSGNGTQEQAYMGDTATTYNPAQKTTDTNGSTTSDTGESTSEDSSNTSNTVESTGTKTGTTKGTSEDTREQSGTSNTTSKDSRTQSGTESGSSKHSGHLYGNIGVTTSQQMLNAELDLRMTRNWYDLWAEKFTGELCVGIY